MNPQLIVDLEELLNNFMILAAEAGEVRREEFKLYVPRDFFEKLKMSADAYMFNSSRIIPIVSHPTTSALTFRGAGDNSVIIKPIVNKTDFPWNKKVSKTGFVDTSYKNAAPISLKDSLKPFTHTEILTNVCEGLKMVMDHIEQNSNQGEK